MKQPSVGQLKSTAFRFLILAISGMLIYGNFFSPVLWPAYAQAPQPPRVNVPYFEDYDFEDYDLYQGAIFWFGQVNNTSNYADVRLGYNNDELLLTLHIIDRRLWYDPEPAASDLTDWDAVTMYLHLDGNTGDVPTSRSYRLVAQLNWWEARTAYQTAYRGDGSGWVAASIPFTATSSWRGNAPLDDDDDKGWWVQFRLPFASLEGAGPPPPGSTWGLALVLHDRDDAIGTPIPDQTWPDTMDAQRPASWGQLVFGQPAYVPPSAMPGEMITVRHGLNGAAVIDAHVGGNFTCGAGIDHWTEWGEANYSDENQNLTQVNIQNQWDVADWPCFSKYYVTFPLDAVPPAKEIISATLTMSLFGNAGYNPGDARPSLIQALTIAEDWDEALITWNNAPLAAENVASTWVYPVAMAGEKPYHWDVSRAVAEAYAAGTPLRLALYSADGEYHSGKYFWSSDVGDWNATGRPTLDILLGDAAFELNVTPFTQLINSGQTATYTVEVQHHPNFAHDVSLQVGASPSAELEVSLVPPVTFSPPDGGQTTLILSDTHDSSFSTGLWYTVQITATGGGITRTTIVDLLLNGSKVYLPTVIK